MVARANGEDPALLAQEAATALGAVDGGAALVTACRRLVDRQSACGPLWWVAARVLASTDPAREAMVVGDQLGADRTSSALVRSLPEDARVAVLGWPRQAAHGLRRRRDVSVSVINAGGEGPSLVSQLRRAGGTVSLVPESGLGQAVVGSDLVLLEAMALGESGLAAVAGSRAAAAVACDAGIPVWAVAGVGRVLPTGLWDSLRSRVSADEGSGRAEHEVVPARLVDMVVGPEAVVDFRAALGRIDCVAVPELTRRAPAPGSAVG
ncbi:MAG TPA: hypothetical protein VM121_00130 [Acidimicrobiales bacterium]|nr:hypothetical protein [Acidimicrobiales bacterium]